MSCSILLNGREHQRLNYERQREARERARVVSAERIQRGNKTNIKSALVFHNLLVKQRLFSGGQQLCSQPRLFASSGLSLFLHVEKWF